MSIFEKIVRGEIPCHKVWEDENHLAFLDIRPVCDGHTLVIPKKPIDPITKLDDVSFQNLWLAAKRVAEILRSEIVCERICFAVVGFEVPHAHIHLIPARGVQDFPWPGGLPEDSGKLALLAKKLRGDRK